MRLTEMVSCAWPLLCSRTDRSNYTVIFYTLNRQ